MTKKEKYPHFCISDFSGRQSDLKIMENTEKTRVEHDLLGTRELPADALYGIQTLRGQENFSISRFRLEYYPAFINGLAYTKMAAAEANHRLGLLTDEQYAAIKAACEDIIAGKSTTQVARELNAEGVLTPLEYKGIHRKNQQEKKMLWTHQRILEMLGNIKYTGCMVNHTRESRKIRDKAGRKVPQEEWIIHENAHEAIVSMEEFEAAKEALRKVRSYHRNGERETFPFYCAHCGRKLQKTFGNDVHFSCMTPYWKEEELACRQVRWDKTKIEKVILETLKAQIAVMNV